jgi:hypothetical protein
MDIYDWVRNAIADPNLTPLRKLLRRRDLDPKLRSSVQAFVEHDEVRRPYEKWVHENSCTLSAVHECNAIPIVAATNQDRWRHGLRERQYGEIRHIIEEIGCPLKRELIAKGIAEDAIRVDILLGLGLEPDSELLNIVSTAAQLDYDPGDPVRWAAEFEAARRGGCDRNGIMHPVFTLCGRVHGYFEENESLQFDYEWQKEHDKRPAKYETLRLNRVTVKLTGTPSFERYVETLSPADRQKAMEQLTGAGPTPPSASAVPKGPTISASFLDFAEGIDAPIRFERGKLLQEGRKPRAVDRETGDYVEWDLPHWQSPTSHYRLYSADGTALSTSIVQQETVDLSGDGQVGLYKVRVLRIDQAAGDGSWSEITDASAPVAQKFARFIAALWLDNPARHSAEIIFDLGGR